jgi:hypothetical protein
MDRTITRTATSGSLAAPRGEWGLDVVRIAHDVTAAPRGGVDQDHASEVRAGFMRDPFRPHAWIINHTGLNTVCAPITM